MLTLPADCSLLIAGDGEGEMYAIQGRLVKSAAGACFIQNDGGGRLEMEQEWLERAKPVTQELHPVFGSVSRFFIPLSIGSLPESATQGEFQSTNIRLPLKRRDA